MQLFTVHQIEHVKLLLLEGNPYLFIPHPCILLSEVLVSILPLKVSPSILPSEVPLPILPFRVIS